MLPVLAPMLATSGRPVGDLAAWAAEPKLDGWRCQVTLDASLPHGGRVCTRPGRDITDRLDVVAGLADIGVDVVLDGELVAGAGRLSDFYDVVPALARRHRRERLTFVAFDLLAFAGEVIINEPYAVRRQLLDRLVALSNGCLTAVPSWAGTDAELLLDACDSHLVEGLVLKRLNSVYTPGRRFELLAEGQDAQLERSRRAAPTALKSRRRPTSDPEALLSSSIVDVDNRD